MKRIACSECDWRGTDAEADHVQDPKGPDVWQVCPKCRTPEHLEMVCDEPDCWLPVSCGTPTPTGYRSTCHHHYPRDGGML